MNSNDSQSKSRKRQIESLEKSLQSTSWFDLKNKVVDQLMQMTWWKMFGGFIIVLAFTILAIITGMKVSGKDNSFLHLIFKVLPNGEFILDGEFSGAMPILFACMAVVVLLLVFNLAPKFLDSINKLNQDR